MNKITAGFLPLLDAAILIVAKEMGFAEALGIDLRLVRETSWANMRDRVSVGQFDVAHMLAPLPIAQNLGLSPLSVPMVAPFALGLGGNAITVSNAVWSALDDVDSIEADAKRAGEAVSGLVKQRKAQDQPLLSFAVVHNFSAHAYELRYWLAASGVDPQRDVSITIVPPGLMPDALASGAIDGYCVGEPWNSVAVALGVGKILTTKASIWRSSPEKVLGLTRRWAEQNVDELDALLLALHHSAKWCDASENREALGTLLALPEYLGVDIELPQKKFLQFCDGAANFPWQSHALWFYAQMVRWDQVSLSDANRQTACDTYRPDLYRRALKTAGIAMPGASSKVEGALTEATYVPAQGGHLILGPDGFFDGVKFDPDKLADYIRASPFHGALHNI
jgi:two-component system, oxyanion-binding sensor